MIKLYEVEALPTEEKERLILEKLGIRALPWSLWPAATDLAVHMKACEWDAQGLLGNYFHALEELLCKVGGDTPDENPSLYSMMHYRIGMFSTAALFTLLHYEEWIKSDEAERLRSLRGKQ